METLSDIAFVTIFLTALIDAFFLTGLVFYGIFLMGTAATLYALQKISATELFVASFLGSLLGSVINFYLGHFFGHVRFFKKFTDGTKVAYIKKRLADDGLFYTMAFGKFIGIFRPLYALILGVLHTDQKRFLMFEILLAFMWTTFWLLILLFGKEIYHVITTH